MKYEQQAIVIDDDFPDRCDEVEVLSLGDETSLTIDVTIEVRSNVDVIAFDFEAGVRYRVNLVPTDGQNSVPFVFWGRGSR